MGKFDEMKAREEHNVHTVHDNLGRLTDAHHRRRALWGTTAAVGAVTTLVEGAVMVESFDALSVGRVIVALAVTGAAALGHSGEYAYQAQAQIVTDSLQEEKQR